MIQRHVEPHQVEGAADALPDLLAGHAQVLRAECDVVADACGNHLAVGILQDQADDAAHLRGILAADEQRPGILAVLVIAEHFGDRAEQRRLAGARRPEQEDLSPSSMRRSTSEARPCGGPHAATRNRSRR